jgi:transposase
MSLIWPFHEIPGGRLLEKSARAHFMPLTQDWRRLDQRIAGVSAEIEALAEQDVSCQRLMTVPGVGPIISSAVVAAIGNDAGFKQGRDFGAWLGLVPKQESTGDRTILGKVSKRGNTYPRAVRAGRARRPGTAAACGDAGFVALDRAGIEAAPPQHAGDRPRQQDRTNGLGQDGQESALQGTHRACSVNEIAPVTRRNPKVGRANST